MLYLTLLHYLFHNFILVISHLWFIIIITIIIIIIVIEESHDVPFDGFPSLPKSKLIRHFKTNSS